MLHKQHKQHKQHEQHKQCSYHYYLLLLLLKNAQLKTRSSVVTGQEQHPQPGFIEVEGESEATLRDAILPPAPNVGDARVPRHRRRHAPAQLAQQAAQVVEVAC